MAQAAAGFPRGLALAIVTIERPAVVQRLIRSVRAYFPDMPILVADQSRRIEPMLSFYRSNRVAVIPMPFDAGVAASRNRLVHSVRDEFFVLCDDDFIFDSRTCFDDALAILRAKPEVGIVGGALRDTSDGAAYRRHWETYLQYDPANRLLASIPIYHFAPVSCSLGSISCFYCDTVMNFAVCRRSMFSQQIQWDERFKSNGEHEDFYLNLKLNGRHRVVYLPSMQAEHNHPYRYINYQSRLRDRDEGWRSFAQKWQIAQYLEIGNGVRCLDDPGTVAGPDVARSHFYLPVQALSGTPAHTPLQPLTLRETELGKIGLSFRYDPILKQDTDFTLWYRAALPAGERALANAGLAIWLRWFASNGSVLIWQTEASILELGHDHWLPLPVDIPLPPNNSTWLRFDIVACCGDVPVPAATGFIFPWRDSSEPPSYDVVALSRVRGLVAELPVARPLRNFLAKQADAAVGPPLHRPHPGSVPLLLLRTDQLPSAAALQLTHWTGVSYTAALASARLPGADLEAPALIALPACSAPSEARVLAAGERCGGAVRREPQRQQPFAPREIGVTAVLTSCGRQDLLERTLDSFFMFNTCRLDAMIVIEDGNAEANAALMRKFRDRGITWIGTQRRLGQIAAIDRAYCLVKSGFIFHMEDDWEFYAPGFIEKSFAVLQADPACLQVWLRSLDDTNGHPLAAKVECPGGVVVRRLELCYLEDWNGFSFNPGLRRTADYRRLGCYGEHARFDPRDPGAAEAKLSRLYRSIGMHAVILADNGGRGYVRHIGAKRSVPPA